MFTQGVFFNWDPQNLLTGWHLWLLGGVPFKKTPCNGHYPLFLVRGEVTRIFNLFFYIRASLILNTPVASLTQMCQHISSNNITRRGHNSPSQALVIEVPSIVVIRQPSIFQGISRYGIHNEYSNTDLAFSNKGYTGYREVLGGIWDPNQANLEA